MKFSDIKDLGQALVGSVTKKIESIDVESIKGGVAKIKGKVEDAANGLADRISEKLDEQQWSRNPYGTEFGRDGKIEHKKHHMTADEELEERKLAANRFDYSSRFSFSSRSGLTEYQQDIFFSLIDAQFYNTLGLNNTQFRQLFAKLMEFGNQQVCKKIYIILEEIENNEEIFSNDNIFEILTNLVSASEKEIDETLFEYLKEQNYGLTSRELNAFEKKVLNYNLKYLFIDEEHNEIISEINNIDVRDEKLLDNLINSVERIKTADEKRNVEPTESLVDRATQAVVISEANKRKEDIRLLIKSFNEKCDNEIKRTLFDNLLNTVVKNSISIEKATSISEIIIAIKEEELSKIDFDKVMSMFDNNLAYLLNNDKAEDYLGLVFDSVNNSNAIALAYNLCLNETFVDKEDGRQILFDISSLTFKNGKLIDKKLLDLLNIIFSNINFNKLNTFENNPIDAISRVIVCIHSSIKASKKSITQAESDFIEEEVAPYIIGKLDLLKNINTIKQIVKVYDGFYEMNSYLLNSYPNGDLVLYGYVTESKEKDVKSSLLVNGNDKSLLIYSADGEFLTKMNSACSEQENTVIRCSEEIIGKYPTEYYLIAKYKDKYCNIPVTSNKSVNNSTLVITLPDNTFIEVDLNNSTIKEVDPTSPIMNDITKRIIDSEGIVLRKF